MQKLQAEKDALARDVEMKARRRLFCLLLVSVTYCFILQVSIVQVLKREVEYANQKAEDARKELERVIGTSLALMTE